nr:alpha/beta hydrolase [Micromonospora sp. DSM 115978]
MPDAIVLPGRMFGPGAPLPMYAGDVAALRGARVHRHEWSVLPPRPSEPEVEGWVIAEARPLVDAASDGPPLLIGKSLGTNAAALAADRALPAVWLTPLLTTPWIVAALERATAPCLLVGGTADPSWDGATARRLSPHVFEVADADHGLYVPGPLTDSIAALGRMATAVEEFLADLGWPD